MARNREVRQLVAELKEKCRFIADTLRHLRKASEKELADYWPGGEQNSDLDLRGWIFCYANYTRFCDRLPDADNPAGSGPASNSDEVIKALADEPERVVLQNGKNLTVYPKSFLTLVTIESLDRQIAWLIKRRDELSRERSADALDLFERASDEIAHQYGLLAWCATHEGPGLPFDASLAAPPLPQTLSELSPIDLLAIHRAFQKVNGLRLAALYLELRALNDKSVDGSRPSWQTFFALREDESHTAASILMRDRSLTAQVASSILVADAKQKAVDAVKRESDREQMHA